MSRAAPDFPFYNGRPVAIAWWGWLVVLAATGLGFYLLTAPAMQIEAVPLNYLPAILFLGAPLGAMALVIRGHAGALFGRYGWREFGISVGFAVLTITASFVVALTLSGLSSFNANPSAGLLAQMDTAGLLLFLSRTFIQLIGEEVVTILPLLAVLWFCVQKLHLPRTAGIVIAVLVSTAWFASLHLPTYNWNFLQCFGVIGTARLVLTAAYLLTRNLWVSAGAHILNDWSIFVLSFAGSHMPIGVSPIDPA